MKKIAIPVIVLLLVSLLVACTNGSDANEYTGDFNEYNNLSSSADNVGVSNTGSTSDIVTVPLTTQQGATVPPVTTTQPTTTIPTIDYTPIVPDTTKPIPNTTYYSDPNTTTSNALGSFNTTDPTSSDTTEKTTSAEVKYVKINPSFDTDIHGEENNTFWVMSIVPDNFKGKPLSSSGKDAVVNINGQQYASRSYKVLSKLDDDERIAVEVDTSGLEFADGDQVTITLQEGSIKTDENYSNKKFTSSFGYAGNG